MVEAVTEVTRKMKGEGKLGQMRPRWNFGRTQIEQVSSGY